MVPAGIPVTLREGKTGFITQALGGSFTVYVEGNLFRIAGKDAAALGKEALIGPELPPDATDDDVKQLVWDQMRACYDRSEERRVGKEGGGRGAEASERK